MKYRFLLKIYTLSRFCPFSAVEKLGNDKVFYPIFALQKSNNQTYANYSKYS